MNAAPFQPFETWQTPLERGISLIEASAGTGKTHAIVALVLRMIVEERIPIENILVVTYTEAATAELRTRLRRALSDAAACLDGKPVEDPAWNLPVSLKRKPGALELVDSAVKSFDLAQVRTIHGFCASVLNENAFETASLFESEIVPSDARLIREIMEDFWRLHVSTASSLLARVLRIQQCSIEQLAALANAIRTAPEAVLEVESKAAGDLQTEARILEETFAAAAQSFRDEASIIRKSIEIFAASHRLNKGCKPEELQARLADIQTSLCGSRSDAALVPMLGMAQSYLRNGVYKRQKEVNVPEHPFFLHCEELAAACSRYRDALLRNSKSYFEREIETRRSIRGVRGYTDLLIELAERVNSPGSELLRTALLSRYNAVLIDEYQDTDPLQYEIFHTIFASSPEHLLFLIGDPKQSIFAFRGADIHTYLRTNADAARRYTLTLNFRSAAPMVEAVNWLYSSAEAPFGHQEIQFHRITAAGKITSRLTQNDVPVPALGVFAPENELLDALPPVRMFHRWAANRAAELLRSRCKLGDKEVRPGDIAILSRRNADALRIQEYLRELGIPAVLQKSGNLFQSEEALELERVLAAMIEPSRLSRVRAALLTPIFDWTLDDLAESEQSSERWQRQLESFVEASKAWRIDGFACMFKKIIAEESMMQRLLLQPGGERKMVNYLHLLECIEQAARDEQLSPEGILEWLKARRLDLNSGIREEYELRLESDEAAVKLVTIHKCKGMQYPIVIAPDLWRPGFTGYKHGVAVATEEGKKKVFASREVSPRVEELMKKEVFEEDARILYVALTRSVHHCSILWHVADAEISALDRILPQLKVVSLLNSRVEDVAEIRSFNRLEAPPTEADGQEYQAAAGPLAPRLQPAISVANSWGIYSFSSLKVQLENNEAATELETPDLAADETPTGPQEALLEDEAEGPPGGGTRLGAMLHVIYERHRFDRPDELSSVIAEAMAQYGYATNHSAWVERRIRASLETPLIGDTPLQKVPDHAIRKEMEFHFPTKRSRAADLQAIIRSDSDRQPVPSTRRGYLKGFIDLIFRWDNRYYILDWKSNFLGKEASAWSQDSLARAMRHSYYDLQYHLYTSALNRLLKLRLPGYSYDSHFGGVFYLFIRGMDPLIPGNGVFFARPTIETVEKFEAEFSQEPQA